ncbi:LamG-like jellyroll fold domain-containing protein [Micromonospora parva]|uniref:LamG-like jellyroll fold domain-containing protein n=1 Tax=Micromonospora parva TaxID=1464048 RepID=UPI00378FFE5D
MVFDRASRSGRRWAGVFLAGLMAATLTGPVGWADAKVAVPNPGARSLVADDEFTAATMAKRYGLRVEVALARTELTQTFADPSGAFVMESAVVPQRARQPDGTWADINLNLTSGSDGLLRPIVSTADVRFSKGGTEQLVSLSRGGRTFTLSWPTKLPAAVLSGDMATYPEVLPEVDLVVRATPDGFTHVLVVKTPQAARNPAVGQIAFRVGGDVRLRELPGGELQAVAADNSLVGAAPQPVMWDSSRLLDDSPGGGSGYGSSPAGPGDGASTAPVGADVDSSGQLVLRPDLSLLHSGSPTYPVYIDPPWSTGRARWAYASSDNGNNDTSVARVGRSPDSGQLYRSYFEFPLAAIGGKYIRSAYVQMKLDHSWSCGNTVTHMYDSSAISTTPRTKWRPSNKAWLASAESHANEAGGCGEIQPDMTVNFQHGNVTSLIRRGATNKWKYVTIGFCACNADGDYESTQDRWKRFFPGNAKLIVDYDSYPGKPTALQVAGVACATSGRTTIGTLTPTLSAVYPDADSTQALRTAVEWLEIPASGTYNDSTPRKTAPPVMSVPAGGRSTTAAVPTLQPGKAYAFRTRATDPAPYNLTGEWSTWCEFAPDTAVPPVTVTATTVPDAAGKAGSFTISSTKTTVTKFRYGWTSPPTTEIAATGTSEKSVSLPLTVPRYGRNVLYAQAVDSTGNIGNGSTELIVDRSSPPVARWGLEFYPGVDQAEALADRQPALNGRTDLTAATGVTWTPDIRLIAGRTVSLNTSSTSNLSASGPVVDTSMSFSAAAWVRLRSAADCVGNQTVMSVDGVQASAFFLAYDCASRSWRMRVSDRDQAVPLLTSAVAPAVVNQWTHVAGSWDASERKVLLYLNGKLAATAQPTAAWLASYGSGWAAPGPFVIGRDRYSGNNGGQIAADVADVQVFNRVLVGHDFTGQASSDPMSGGVNEPGLFDPTRVNDWDFTSGVSCYAPPSNESGLCEAPATPSAFNRRLALTHGSQIGAGHWEQGLNLDDVHYTENPNDPYFGLRTLQYGRSQDNVGTPTSPVWRDAPILRTDQSFSVSVWVRPEEWGSSRVAVGQSGSKESAFYLQARETIINGVPEYRWQFTVTGQDDNVTPMRVHAAMASRALTPIDDLGAWTHLVGVYDAQAAQIRLYVNGVLEQTTACTRVFAANGPLTVGAALYSGPGEQPRLVDYWQGGIDDMSLYQGVLSDAAVERLFDQQATE